MGLLLGGKIMKLKTLSLALGAFMASTAIAAAADCEKLVLGSAISLTGKYATNGVHAKNGYEFAIKKIDENGGVKIGDWLSVSITRTRVELRIARAHHFGSRRRIIVSRDLCGMSPV